jgi:hypothetical protein
MAPSTHQLGFWQHFSLFQRLLLGVGVVSAVLGVPFLFADVLNVGVPLIVAGCVVITGAVLATTVGLHNELDAIQTSRAELRIFHDEGMAPMFDKVIGFRRIGVQNRSEIADATSVEVELLSIVPPPHFTDVDPLPCRLGRMNAPSAERGTESITIQPLRRVYFDVLTQRMKNVLLLTTVATGQVIRLKSDQEYTLTVRASAGHMGHGDEAQFQLVQNAAGALRFECITPGDRGV